MTVWYTSLYALTVTAVRDSCLTGLKALAREVDIVMSGDQWKLLIATADSAEVHLLKGRLESEGISCRIETQKKYPGSSNPGRPLEFRAYVPVNDFEASLQVLEEEDLEEDL